MKHYPGYDALLPKAEQEALEASIRRRAEAEERAATEGPVKERDAGTGDRTYLLATIDELRAPVEPVPTLNDSKDLTVEPVPAPRLDETP